MRKSFHTAGWWKIVLGGVAGAAVVSGIPWVSRGSQRLYRGRIEKFWPSEFGPDDQRGAANRITPAKVAGGTPGEKGQIYQLGRLYEHGMPIPGKRHFSLTIPGLPTASPTGSNNIVSNDELVSGEIGQVGTQFDGLGHVGVHFDGEDYFYKATSLRVRRHVRSEEARCRKRRRFLHPRDLLDVCALRGKDRLPAGYVISPDELASCLKNANLEIQEGDVVLIRTGHGKLWMKDNATYGAGEPGIGLEAAKFLTDRKVALIGADNWAIEAFPHERADIGVSGAPVGLDEERRLPPGKPRSGTTGRGWSARVLFCVQPAASQGRDGLSGKPDRHSLSNR